jgi:hypothetical protein
MRRAAGAGPFPDTTASGFIDVLFAQRDERLARCLRHGFQ